MSSVTREEVIELLRNFQQRMAAKRGMCDEHDGALWDNAESVIAALQAAEPEGYVAIGKSDLVTRREYGETADEASEKMERTGFYTYEIKELYALQPAPAAVPEGWQISRTEDGNIIVQKSHVAGFVASEKSGGIAESTLYYLAGDLLTASPAPEHSGDGNEMVGWISVNEQTPSQGERVLLKIDLEDCPVVGYWGCGRYEACTVNMEVSCGAFCYGGNVDGSFSGEDVTHWMPLPNPPQQEETERC